MGGALAASVVAGCGGRSAETVVPQSGVATISLAAHPTLSKPGGYVGINVQGIKGQILVFRSADGTVGAVSRNCPHFGCPLRFALDEDAEADEHGDCEAFAEWALEGVVAQDVQAPHAVGAEAHARGCVHHTHVLIHAQDTRDGAPSACAPYCAVGVASGSLEAGARGADTHGLSGAAPATCHRKRNRQRPRHNPGRNGEVVRAGAECSCADTGDAVVGGVTCLAHCLDGEAVRRAQSLENGRVRG
jgi:hypothetical protein